MSNALYIGSFDMFTNGHLDVLRQAADIFDKIYVVVGVNNKKVRTFSAISSASFITDTLKNEPFYDKIEVHSSIKFAPDIAQDFNCDYIIRGLRNSSDYMFEEQVAQVYKAANKNLKIIYFYANNNISSSMVKYLYFAGKSIDDFVSGNIEILRLEEC